MAYNGQKLYKKLELEEGPHSRRYILLIVIEFYKFYFMLLFNLYLLFIFIYLFIFFFYQEWQVCFFIISIAIVRM